VEVRVFDVCFFRRSRDLRPHAFFFVRPPFLISSFFFFLFPQNHRAYGDLSLMPKTDSIVAVSLNDGVIQAGDAWRRRQGYFSKDAEDW